VQNWQDDFDLGWTLRDIYANWLKLSPITESQLGEPVDRAGRGLEGPGQTD
jgi:hypothetical protein